MCRWGCPTTDTTYMCKWCGTRFCKACLRGEFGTGHMKASTWCFQCNQKRCLGKRVDYVVPAKPDSKSSGRGKGRGKQSKSGTTAKSSKSNKSLKSKKGKKK